MNGREKNKREQKKQKKQKETGDAWKERRESASQCPSSLCLSLPPTLVLPIVLISLQFPQDCLVVHIYVHMYIHLANDGWIDVRSSHLLFRQTRRHEYFIVSQTLRCTDFPRLFLMAFHRTLCRASRQCANSRPPSCPARAQLLPHEKVLQCTPCHSSSWSQAFSVSPPPVEQNSVHFPHVSIPLQDFFRRKAKKYSIEGSSHTYALLVDRIPKSAQASYTTSRQVQVLPFPCLAFASCTEQEGGWGGISSSLDCHVWYCYLLHFCGYIWGQLSYSAS